MVNINKILCAIDFSVTSRQVAAYAVYFAEKTGAEITVLYVAPSLSQYVGFHVPPSSIENFAGDVMEGAEKSMQKFMEENFSGVKAKNIIRSGYPAEEIIETAANEDASLIVMGTHGRKGFDRVLFGSVAEKVVKSASIPVMTVRPDDTP